MNAETKMGLQQCGLNLNSSKKELKSHGTMDFPCAGYNEIHTDQPDDCVPWHWHDEIEIIYVTSGTLKVLVPPASYTVTKDSGVIINAGLLHYAEAQPQCVLHSLVFSQVLITGAADSVYAKKYMQPLISCPEFRSYKFSKAKDPEMADDFTTAFQALAEDRPGYEFIVRERLSHLCYATYRVYEDLITVKQVSHNLDDTRIRAMLDFIQNRYAGPVTLAQIADAAGIGERECLRCFERLLHISPMQYLLKYRVMQGAEMLKTEPEKSVADIATACGFDSPSYFSKLFRRYIGSTPFTYRKA
jgi:AraC-like DNA-binding protein